MTAPRRIEQMVVDLRAVAERVGPLHAYWEMNFDLEAILRGEMRGPAAEQAIGTAEQALEQRRLLRGQE